MGCIPNKKVELSKQPTYYSVLFWILVLSDLAAVIIFGYNLKESLNFPTLHLEEGDGWSSLIFLLVIPIAAAACIFLILCFSGQLTVVLKGNINGCCYSLGTFLMTIIFRSISIAAVFISYKLEGNYEEDWLHKMNRCMERIDCGDKGTPEEAKEVYYLEKPIYDQFLLFCYITYGLFALCYIIEIVLSIKQKSNDNFDEQNNYQQFMPNQPVMGTDLNSDNITPNAVYNQGNYYENVPGIQNVPEPVRETG